MEQNNFTNLTNKELLEKQKKLKSSKKLNSFLIGMCFGIAGYSTIKNGFGVFTFFPLIIVYFIFNNSKKLKAIQEELKARNLN